MRRLTKADMKQRGCDVCLDKTMIRENNKNHDVCKHEKCPYTVLDNYETYDEFLASKESRILVENFFSQVANCYTLGSISSKPQRMFSDRILHI